MTLCHGKIMMDNTFNEENWFDLVTKECEEYPIQPARSCIDIGANVGGFVEAYKNHIRNFFCVEPGSANREELKSHHANLIESGRLVICPHAVGEYSGENVRLKRFRLGEDNRANSGSNSTVSFVDEHGNGYAESTDYEEVTTISLEDVIEKALSYFETNNIDLLKVDCEGAEYDLLVDKDLSRVDSIVMELHNWLDCEASKNDIMVNKKWHMLEHISKTHDITTASNLTEHQMVIPKQERHGFHAVVRWDRKKGSV